MNDTINTARGVVAAKPGRSRERCDLVGFASLLSFAALHGSVVQATCVPSSGAAVQRGTGYAALGRSTGHELLTFTHDVRCEAQLRGDERVHA